MQHIIPIQPGKVAFGETEVMDGIQQVGFANAIFTTNADDPFRKGKRPVTVVFELNQRYVLKTKHMKAQDTRNLPTGQAGKVQAPGTVQQSKPGNCIKAKKVKTNRL